MITIRLLGGLGNQMFQYAYGLALKEKGYDVGFESSQLVPNTHREYSLDGLNADVWGGSQRNQPPVIYESGMRYQEQYMNPPETCTLVGYWQTEQYFKNVIPKVLKAFEFKEPLSPRAACYMHDIKEYTDSTFIHFRRKDYVGLEHVHGIPSSAYYAAALQEIKSWHTFVFSDDIEWCKQTLWGPEYTFIEGTTKFEDLQLMKACKHAILANSSFSWWGAWLGDCQQPRTVIAPQHWFNPKAGIDDTDIVPERWRRM